MEGAAAGRRLFLAPPNKKSRAARVESGLKSVQKILREAAEADDPNGLAAAAQDGVFLAIHLHALDANIWFGANSWQREVMEEMTVPGNTLDDVVRVMCRGLAPGAVSTDEVHEVVE